VFVTINFLELFGLFQKVRKKIMIIFLIAKDFFFKK